VLSFPLPSTAHTIPHQTSVRRPIREVVFSHILSNLAKIS
jgi:hypothetical protein